MSDWSGKWRPALERIACMVGKGKGLPYLPSGAIPNFTDHDICHAVAAARQVKDGKALQKCARPEILELCYAGDVTKVPKIARAAADAITTSKRGDAKVPTHDTIRARHGGLIAARSVAGRMYTQGEIKGEAWSIACNYETLELDIGRAKAWIEGELFEASFAFLQALKSRLDHTVHDVSAYQKGLSAELDRDRREHELRKEYPQASDMLIRDVLAGRDERTAFHMLKLPPLNARRMKVALIGGGKYLEIDYTNHAGERSTRRISDPEFWYGSTNWHTQPQWLINAFDMDKRAERDFALCDVHAWKARKAEDALLTTQG